MSGVFERHEYADGPGVDEEEAMLDQIKHNGSSSTRSSMLGICATRHDE